MTSEIHGQLQAFYDQEVGLRTARTVSVDRRSRLEAFLEEAGKRHVRSVIEVGCGPGREGVVIQGAGLRYTGIDLSAGAVTVCHECGLTAIVPEAAALPFATGSFDAAWSMSTLMHLPGAEFSRALRELGRIVRRGGVVEIGVWGHTQDRDWTSPDGRYFRHRTDDSLRAELARVGPVLEFDTWSWLEHGGHYQWARLEVGAGS
jgi:SAM-dependent methyltransferase